MIVDANGKRDGLQIFVELQQQFVGRHGADESAFSWIHLWILCGFHGEVEKDFFVLADNSIIGIISQVSTRTAKVRLFTNPGSNIKVRINGNNKLMKGCGNNQAKVEMLKRKMKVGDEIMASKIPGFLDTPTIIGKVVRCEHNDQPLLWDITVEPVCDIQKIESLHVIVMNPSE